MAGWQDLQDELARWHDTGRRATLWWRDDDAVAATPELDRLLALSDGSGVPLCLAVIPGAIEDSLAGALESNACAVLQHGFRHTNHAPADEKKSEFGAHRPVYELLADAAIGFESLRAIFGERHLPVFVPPWNRVDDGFLGQLPLARIETLSRFKARCSAFPAHGLGEVNCHVDPIDWRGSRGFAGEEAVLTALTAHLSARRTGKADAAEPTGLLTHHLVMENAVWRFLERLFSLTNASDVAHWLNGTQVFRVSP